MSDSPSKSDDSQNIVPGVSSEKKTGPPGRSPEAGAADKTVNDTADSDTSGLPSYMRASSQEGAADLAPGPDDKEFFSEFRTLSSAPEEKDGVEDLPSRLEAIFDERHAENADPEPPQTATPDLPEAAEQEPAPAAGSFTALREDVAAGASAWDLGEAKKAGAGTPVPPVSPVPPASSGKAKPTPSAAKKKASTSPKAPRPLYPSFASTHPVLSVGQTGAPSMASRMFNGLAVFPLIPLTVMLVLQTIFTLDSRALWFSDEIRHAAAFQSLLDQGKWLILEMNGQVYPDKPPLYFLFLRGLYELVRTNGPMLHFTAAAVSALLYLWAALGLGRMAARVDRRTNLAAGIILLSTGYIMGVVHYARMDLLFSALILCSHIALYRAFVSPAKNYPGMILGFLLAGLAVLVKGPLGLAFPICSIALFALWRGSPLRLLRPDFIVGLLAGLLPILLWLGGIYWTTGNVDFIVDSLIKKQVFERAVDTFHHKEAWYYYLVRLPLMCLPWVLLFFFLPWRGFMSKSMRAGLAASRRPEGEGIAFLWSMVLSALVLLSLLSGKILIYLLPVLPALAILAARAALGLEGLRAKLFRITMALLILAAAIALVLGALMLFDLLPVPDIKGMPQWTLDVNGTVFIVAAILLLVAALLWTVLSGSRSEGVLLVFALACTVLGYPLASLVAPSFDAVLSPKAQALLMRAYIQNGYAPASYKVYGGTYTFYAGHTVPELPSLDGLSSASDTNKMVVGMPRAWLAEWENKPECFQEVHSQWIETKAYVLLACPAVKDMKPAAVPYKPAPDVPGELMKLMGLQSPAKPEETKPAKIPQAPATEEGAPAAVQPGEGAAPQVPVEEPKQEAAPQAPAEEPSTDVTTPASEPDVPAPEVQAEEPPATRMTSEPDVEQPASGAAEPTPGAEKEETKEAGQGGDSAKAPSEAETPAPAE